MSSIANTLTAMDYPLPILTLIVTILTTFWWVLKKSRNPNPPLPPGPRGLPFVGYMPFLGPISNLHRTLTQLASTHGPIYKLWLGSKLWVIITSPTLVNELIHEDRDLILNNRNHTIAASITTYQGADLFGSHGPYWREMRKIFAGKMLNGANVDACYGIRRREVHKAIRDAHAKSVGVPIDVDELLYVTMTNVMINTAVGGGGDAVDISEKFRSVLQELIFLPMKANISDMFPMLARFDIQGIERETRKLASFCDQMLDSLIQRRTEDGINKGSSTKDLLQILLEFKQGETNNADGNTTSFTMTQLKALLMNAIVGGSDAPAKSANWVMRVLMKHPEAMRMVKQELAEVVGQNDIVEETHLPKLHYLDAVIKETMRLYPPVPLLIPRSPTKSFTIGGYTIPKDTYVYLSAWSIHRDPLVWDNPLEFRPERFLDESCKIDYLGNNPQYFPFGSGKRMCAGISLAKKMLPYVLASFLHSFDWKLGCEVEQLDFSNKFEFILTAKEPLIAIPTSRQSQMNVYLHSY